MKKQGQKKRLKRNENKNEKRKKKNSEKGKCLLENFSYQTNPVPNCLLKTYKSLRVCFLRKTALSIF